MSTRAKLASVIAAGGVIAAGWTIGLNQLNSATESAATSSTSATSTTSGSSLGSADSGSQSSSSTSDATGTTSGGTSSSSSSSQAGSGSSSGSGSSGSATASGTFTGTTVSHRYGSVQVTVTLTNGKITGLTQKVVSDGDHHSQMINERSVPTLRSEILSAGSLDGISTISGATYTTEAYLSSLQSALDQAA